MTLLLCRRSLCRLLLLDESSLSFSQIIQNLECVLGEVQQVRLRPIGMVHFEAMLVQSWPQLFLGPTLLILLQVVHLLIEEPDHVLLEFPARFAGDEAFTFLTQHKCFSCQKDLVAVEALNVAPRVIWHKLASGVQQLEAQRQQK